MSNNAQVWRSIDTAPIDGSEVLITGEGVCAVASWSECSGWRDSGDMGWGGLTCVEPTHWMPLPQLPSVEG